VIGLQALAKLAEKLSKDTSSVQIEFKYEKGQNYININSGNSMILQKQIVSLNESLHIYMLLWQDTNTFAFLAATFDNTICQYNSVW